MNEIDRLYAIPEEEENLIEQMIDSDGVDLTVPGEYQKLPMFHPQSVAHRLMYYEAKIRGLEAEYRPIIDAMEADLAHLAKKKENLINFLRMIVPAGTEYIDERVAVHYKTSVSVDIVDQEQIPLEYLRTKEPEPDKAEIKRALSRGKEVPGAVLLQNYNIQINPGGEKARAAAKRRAKEKEKNNVNSEE